MCRSTVQGHRASSPPLLSRWRADGLHICGIQSPIALQKVGRMPSTHCLKQQGGHLRHHLKFRGRVFIRMSHHAGLRTRGFFMKRCQPSVTCTALRTDETAGFGEISTKIRNRRWGASLRSSRMPEPLRGCWPLGERT